MSTLIGALRVTLGLDTAAFEKGATAIERRSKKLETSIENFGSKMSSIGRTLSLSVTAPLVAFGVASVKAATESRDAMGQVEASLKSMGGVAGRTKGQLADLATGLMRNSLYDDDEILRKVTANLLTFGKVQGTVFDRAQQVIVDYSAKTGKDLQSSTIMLGKALQDPIKGLAQLGKAGVQFTENQKKLIEGYVATGQIAKAQGIIVDEFTRQTAGSAAAALKAAGPMARVKKSFDELSESVGAALLPAIERIVPYITRVLDAFTNLSPGVQTTVVAVGAFAAALGPLMIGLGAAVKGLAPFLAVLKTIGAEQGLLTMTRAGIAGLVTGFGPLLLAVGAGYLAWKNWDTIGPMLEDIGRGLGIVQGRLATAVDGMGDVLDEFASKAVSSGAVTQAQFDEIAAGLAKMRETGEINPVTMESITDLIARMQEAGAITPQEATKVRKALLGIWTAQDADNQKSSLEKTAGDFKELATNIVAFLDQVDAESDIVGQAIWDAAQTMWRGFQGFTERLNGWGADIRKALAPVVSRMIEVGKDMMRGLVQGILTSGPSVWGAIKGVATGAIDAAKKAVRSHSPSLVFMEIGAYIGEGLALGIEGSSDRVAAAARKMTEAARKAAEETKALLGRLFPEIEAAANYRGDRALIENSSLSSDAKSEALMRLGQEAGGVDRTADIPLSEGVSEQGSLIAGTVDKVLEKFDLFGKKSGAVTVQVAKSFKDMADATVQSLQNLAGAINGGGFLDILSAVVGLGLQLGSIGAFGKKIQTNINSSNVPGFANGTNFAPGGLAVVGERGPELVNLPRGSRVWPNGQGPGMAQKLQVEVVANNNGFGAIVRNHAGQVVAEAAPALIEGGGRAGVGKMAYQQRRRVG